jgi:hypothetical protein
MRRILGLLLIATGLAAAPAAAQSPIPEGFDPGENAALTINSIDSINVVLEPANYDKYAALFTDPIKPLPPATDDTTPERPLIDFKLHNVSVMETWTDLRGEWCGNKGWYNNATAVDNPALYAVSRATGYPKWFADKITMTRSPDGNSATGVVTQLGTEIIRLEWRKDDAAVAAALEAEPWRAHWVQGKGFGYKGHAWSFEGAGDAGPFVKSIHTEEVEGKPTTWDSRVGMVKVTIKPAAHPLLTHGDWTALVPQTVEVPGMLEKGDGENRFYGNSLQCGLEGSTANGVPDGVLPTP